MSAMSTKLKSSKTVKGGAGEPSTGTPPVWGSQSPVEEKQRKVPHLLESVSSACFNVYHGAPDSRANG